MGVKGNEKNEIIEGKRDRNWKIDVREGATEKGDSGWEMVIEERKGEREKDRWRGLRTCRML